MHAAVGVHLYDTVLAKVVATTRSIGVPALCRQFGHWSPLQLFSVTKTLLSYKPEPKKVLDDAIAKFDS